MKNRSGALCTLGLLFALNTFAEGPSKEAQMIAKALLNSPNEVEKIRKNNSDALTDVKIAQGKSAAIHEVTMTFARDCNCVPSTATLKVTIDQTAMAADGPAKYTSSLSFKGP